MSQSPDLVQTLKEVLGKTALEIDNLKRGRPSIFGYPGSRITPHKSDYYEVYLLWGFVGEVARLQQGLQEFFGFELKELSKPIFLVGHEKTVFFAVEQELSFRPVGVCSRPYPDMPEFERIDLVEFAIDWQGFPIYFKCGYGRKTNRLIFRDRLDYWIGLTEEDNEPTS